MAQVTTNFNLPYPEKTDNADVPSDIQNLAEAVDELFVEKLTDTGWVDLEPQNGTWTRLQYRQIGDIVYVRGSCTALTYSGSSLLIASGLPAHNGNMSRYFFVPAGGARISRWYISNAGDLRLEWTRNISDASEYTSGSSWYEIEYSYCVD